MYLCLFYCFLKLNYQSLITNKYNNILPTYILNYNWLGLQKVLVSFRRAKQKLKLNCTLEHFFF